MLTQSLHQLVTPSQCDAALKQAYKQQKTLQWKKMGLELKMENHLDDLAVIEAALCQNRMDLMMVCKNISGIPEAPSATRKKWEASRTRLGYRINMLEYRKGKLQPEQLLKSELLLQCIEASLEQLALAILELETHKARLLKAAAAGAPPAMTGAGNLAAAVIVPVLKVPVMEKQAASHIQKSSPVAGIADPKHPAPGTPANKGPSN
ncbi:hypothetical protein [Niabella drilacis]|uniref:Uncharacterized protein n=1 Tax=Niabella drilacis (strain DSM 25811 / CCM 8410 / CCUG 62505 / LMG 26954 / E90) TaxID=1285928 RepID=A0A1G7A0D3_NIADE|nr:hypothetical protein [Niabella drilacis]SDE07525.1 hypothetical protein SAMN04487894_12011 [Niabella drilacis]